MHCLHMLATTIHAYASQEASPAVAESATVLLGSVSEFVSNNAQSLANKFNALVTSKTPVPEDRVSSDDDEAHDGGDIGDEGQEQVEKLWSHLVGQGALLATDGRIQVGLLFSHPHTHARTRSLFDIFCPGITNIHTHTLIFLSCVLASHTLELER